jgi:tetratricopeptide (TPR) repeat protein
MTACHLTTGSAPMITTLLAVFGLAAATSPPMELPDDLHARIVTLSEAGDALAERQQFQPALAKYHEALALLPEPVTDWEACTWLKAAIGDAQFLSKDYAAAQQTLSDAMHCPDAIGNPFLHLRLGQAQFELGKLDRAADELARAYLQEGRKIFAGDDPKYLDFIKGKLKPPPGGWPKGW